MQQQFSSTANRILSGLSRADLALIKPHLAPVDLPLRTVLETASTRIDSAYFLDSGFASVVGDGAGKRSVEVGMIGREGMTGLAVVLGRDRPTHETYIQVAGAGQRISAAKLRWAMDESVPLHRSFLRWAHAFLEQTMQTALANARNKNEERLARWLLMADDRLGGGELPLTHRFLAIMLGVQRPGLTLALQALEREGLIKAGRAAIAIVDRRALVKFSNGAYVPQD